MSIDIYIAGAIREAIPYSLSIQASLGQRATFNCRIVSTSGAYRPQQGHVIELYSGAAKLWAGSVDEVAEVSITEAGAAAGAFYDVRGITWEQRLDRRRCYNFSTALPAHYDGTIVVTADASTNTLTSAAAHGLSNGARVRIKAHAQGALAGGLDSAIEYFVVSAASTTLQLSLTSGGAAVDITDAGTLEQVLLTNRAGTIVTDLIANFADNEGIGTTNVDLGAVLDAVTFDADATVADAIGQLATLSNFVWWIDEDRELYFKPRTFAAAPFSISTSSANYRSLTVRRTREDKTNAAAFRVPWTQILVTEESFTGDGTTRTFTLANRLGQIVGMTVNGQDVEFGQWLSESDKAYYWEYGSTRIRQDVDVDVLTSGDTLTVRYQRLGADIVRVEDSADISATITQEGGGSGRYVSYLEREVGQVQAYSEALAIISAKKAAVSEIEYETDEEVEPSCVTLRPGQLQTIANTPRGVSSDSYLIHDVTLSDVAGQYLRFRVRAITGTSLTGVQEFWKALAGQTGGGRGAAPGASTTTPSVPGAPDDVTGLSASYEYADDERVRVKIAFTAPSPLGDFVGVHCWEEPVDQSASAGVPLNSTATLGGTRNLGGTFAPIDRGYHLTSPVTLYLPRPTQTATRRFYLASYSEQAEAELVRANQTGATPNVTLSIAALTYQSGEEYARLVRNVLATVEYDDSQVASPKYRILFGWSLPADAPAAWQRPFGGVQIVYEYANGQRANGPALNVNETSARSDWFDLFVGTNPIRVWFVSMDASEEPRLNTIVTGLTPSAVATVTWPLASRPVLTPYADNVTGFSATNARYVTNAQGQKALLIDLAWTLPSGAAALARWGGAVIWLHLPSGDKFQMTGAETGSAVTIESSAFPQATATWTFYAVSIDNNANPNTDGRSPAVGTPVATISVPPPTAGAAGTEWTSHVTGASFAAATVTASDGTTQQRITATFTAPSDVTWGGVELRVYSGATLFASTSATPSPIAVAIPNPDSATTVTAKLVSFDVNGRTNTEVAGTPQNTLSIGSAAGTLDLRKFLPASTDNFQINGTVLQVKVGTAITIDGSGNLRVAVSGITDSLLATGAVTTAKIAAAAVTATEIGAAAVTNAKLAVDSVQGAVIATSAITETKIATDAVTSPKIIAGAITTAKIAAGAVTANEIAANTITAGKIAAGTITATEIAAGAITTGKIAALAVTASEIAAGAIVAGKIAADAVTATEIAASAVIAGKIATNAVTAGTIAANAVTTAKLDATEISVGGGGSKPGKFGVYNASGSQIGFIGVESGNEGAWFKTLSVGGTSYGTGKIRADSSGNVTISDATLTLALNGVVTSIQNDLAYGTYNGLRVYSTTSGQESPVMITPGAITIGNTLTSGTKFYVSGAYGSNATMNLYDANSAERFRWSAGTLGGVMRIYGPSTTFGEYSWDQVKLLSGGSFAIGTSTGVTNTTSPITSISTGSTSFVTGINTNFVTINYKDHSNTNQTASFLAFASTSNANGISSLFSSTITLAFTGGIRTT